MGIGGDCWIDLGGAGVFGLKAATREVGRRYHERWIRLGQYGFGLIMVSGER